jgi:hypothetical protein
LDLPGAYRVNLSLRGFEGLQRLIISDLRGVAIFQQFALAVFLSLTPRHLGLRFRNFGLRDFEVLPVLLRVEAREKIVLLDLGPDVDGPFEDLAVDPKAEIGLIPGLDLAGERHLLPRFLQLDRNSTHWPNGCRGGFLFFLATRYTPDEYESADPCER